MNKENKKVVWIIRYSDGSMWCIYSTKEEAKKKAREHLDKEFVIA